MIVAERLRKLDPLPVRQPFSSCLDLRLPRIAWWLVSLAVSIVAKPGLIRANEPVAFDSVEASFHAGTQQDLQQAIDGVDAGSGGWSVAPQVTKEQSAIFHCARPVEATRFKLSLVFLSRIPNSFFREFSISTTADPQPSFQSDWETIVPGWFYAIGPQIQAAGGNRLQLTGLAGETVVRVDLPEGNRRVTAFRIDIFPVQMEGKPGETSVGGGPNGDFVLTEFRVDTSKKMSSNVALGSPVKASHPVYMRPEALTDGQVTTFANPQDPRLGADFFFEIDLRNVRTLDHIVLKNRIDGRVPDMLSKIRLALYETSPDANAEPAWKAYWRADGSYPEPGAADVVRASDGVGVFRGRYLRISSDSERYSCPMLAEVEVYESLPLGGLAVQADRRMLAMQNEVMVPAGTRSLSFEVALPASLQLSDLPVRRRLYGHGHHQDWLMAASGSGAADWPCPAPGDYEFQAQVRHSDGEWNEGIFSFPVVVLPSWWQRPSLQIGAAVALLIAAFLFVRHLIRRREAQRVADLEQREAVHNERTRIARDMHDVVGARLTQLAVMHDIFATEHALPTAAASSLDRLKKTAREGVAALDGVVWAVNPSNDTLSNLADYLCHCAVEYLSPLGIECLQDVPTDWQVQAVGAQARHQLLQAFLEALQNVAKHAVASEVTLTLRHEGSHFIVRLNDNGCGLPDDLSGNYKDGLINMRSRLAAVGGECFITAAEGGGTLVEMRLPL